MSDEIRAGDLVVIVKPAACGCASSIGKVFKVLKVGNTVSHCGTCKENFGEGRFAWRSFDGIGHGAQVSRLKRINPPSKGDSLPTRREMKEKIHG